jgi:predicted DNA-binding transcriptional regulator AlpA
LGVKLSRIASMSVPNEILAPTDRELLSPVELAAYLGVPLKTVYKWQSSSPRYGPRCFKVGRHVRYRRGDIDRWLETLAVDDR